MTQLAPPRQTAAPAPRPIGSPTPVYDTVLELLSSRSVTRVLDCPAGEGAFTRRLLDSGYEVSCGDILPEQLRVDEIECRLCDMNDSLCWDDASFDAVTCLNGLHRIWARGRAVREMARVLRPGGYAIISFVNTINLAHRLAFLTSGTILPNTLGPPHVHFPDATTPASCYRCPLTLGDVIAVTSSVDLSLDGVRPVGRSLKSIGLAPLAILPWLARPFLPSAYKRYASLHASCRPAAMFGDYLVVVARKLGTEKHGKHD